MELRRLNTPSLSTGFVKPKYRPNDINDPPVVWSTAQYQTNLSTDATGHVGHSIRGGYMLSPIQLVVKDTAGTASVVDDIPLNVLGNTLFGSATGEESEPVGISHRSNPPAITQFSSSYSYARVSKTIVDISPTYHETTDNVAIEMFALVYRSDLGIPSGFDPGSTTVPTNIQRVPGLIKWVCFRTGVRGDFIPKLVPKRLVFDMPKFFNDVEWHYDNPASTASTTNFWVAKDGNGLFTSNPNLQLRLRLYARRITPEADVANTFACALRVKHIIEFHRGQGVLPAPNSV